MIEIIEIFIQNSGEKKVECLIIYDKKICYLNGKRYIINEEFISRLENILVTWKSEYGNSNKIDTEEFLIRIKTTNSLDKIHGKGIFPDNYEQLLNLLGELK